MVDAPAQLGCFRWRYGLVALCFAVLAVFRFNGGSLLWAAVFGLSALANGYLSIRHIVPTRLGGTSPREAAPGAPAFTPPESSLQKMRRTLNVYESRQRSWLAIAVAGWIITIGLTLLSPPFALMAATLALFSTFRFRRFRRSERILRRALSAAK